MLVMDHEPIAASDMKREEWWQRLEKHGFVAGNMLRHNVEDDRLYAAARGRRQACRVTHTLCLGTPNICHVLDSECVRSMQVELVHDIQRIRLKSGTYTR